MDDNQSPMDSEFLKEYVGKHYLVVSVVLVLLVLLVVYLYMQKGSMASMTNGAGTGVQAQVNAGWKPAPFQTTLGSGFNGNLGASQTSRFQLASAAMESMSGPLVINDSCDSYQMDPSDPYAYMVDSNGNASDDLAATASQQQLVVSNNLQQPASLVTAATVSQAAQAIQAQNNANVLAVQAQIAQQAADQAVAVVQSGSASAQPMTQVTNPSPNGSAYENMANKKKKLAKMANAEMLMKAHMGNPINDQTGDNVLASSLFA